MKWTRICSLLITFALLLALAACGEAPQSGAGSGGQGGSQSTGGVSLPGDDDHHDAAGRRDYYTSLLGDGEDTVTIMLFLCGSDLETNNGSATRDLNEILYAEIADNVNIIIETGGSEEWDNSVVDPGTNQRWQATNEDLVHLEDVGLRDMTDPDSLADFIQYCAENYPADRYGLVVWDHGGGSVDGYAIDENFPDSESMTIAEFARALDNGGVLFDFVGFDCCLMATAETAFALEPYADYLFASELVEPGIGWYYTDWITALSENSSIPTEELGQVVVDSYIRECMDMDDTGSYTLSVADLTYIRPMFDALYGYFGGIEDALVNEDAFAQVSQARYGSRVHEDDIDHVDLVYLTENLPSANADALAQLVGECVVYNRTTADNYNGLTLYFPYNELDTLDKALGIYEEIGIGEEYRQFIATFSSLLLGGQQYNGGGSGGFGGGYDEDQWSGEAWLDTAAIDSYQNYYQQFSFNGELEIFEKDDYFALSLTDEEWELITDVALRVFLDDGEGYISLGADSLYSFDADGDLMVEFDNTWVAINGELVCFYTVEDYDDGDTWYNYGWVPALVNGQRAEICVQWDSENPYGWVPGYRMVHDGGMAQKGLFEFADGDEVEFICDYYTYDEEFVDSYLFGSLTVDGPLEVSYEDVGDMDCLVYYTLNDIYQNTYWTEALIYSLDW